MKRPLVLLACLVQAALAAPSPPNVVLIYADDLGYGDLGCYGGTGAATPNADKLASGGLRFTNAYSSSSTCTPSRFSLLTGAYPFRQNNTGILPGDAPLIIRPGTTTLPSMFKQAGYTTGIVGKWHLGLGAGTIDWNGAIRPGPNDTGFDDAFIMAATGDRVPTVFIRDRHVVNLDPADPIRIDYKMPFAGEPDGKRDRATLTMDWSVGHNMAVINGIGRIGYMQGGKKALWKDDEMSTEFTREAVSFLERNKDKPFFLYFATHNVHVPRVPNEKFRGKSPMGARGDSIVEFDWQVGQVTAALERLGLAGNTLVILSSDNGPVLDDGYKDRAVELAGSHKPAGPWRGTKYNIHEAGARMPTIVSWKGRVKPGVSDALIGQLDFLASFAAMTGVKLGETAAPDSFNVLPALLGESETGRADLIEHLQLRNRLALREGDWKWIAADKGTKNDGPEAGEQLYNLKDDPDESKNLITEQPETAARLKERLEHLSSSPKTRP